MGHCYEHLNITQDPCSLDLCGVVVLFRRLFCIEYIIKHLGGLSSFGQRFRCIPCKTCLIDHISIKTTVPPVTTTTSLFEVSWFQHYVLHSALPKLGALMSVNSLTILEVKNFHVRRKTFPAVLMDPIFTSLQIKLVKGSHYSKLGLDIP